MPHQIVQFGSLVNKYLFILFLSDEWSHWAAFSPNQQVILSNPYLNRILQTSCKVDLIKKNLQFIFQDKAAFKFATFRGSYFLRFLGYSHIALP